MIIWISGAYGVGKSTLADALKEKLGNALVFDAEEVGNAVRDNYPDAPYGYIFEDYPLWCDFCCRLLKDIHEKFPQTILVPMTLLRATSYASIIERLRNEGQDVRLILLEGSYQTVHDRILMRGEDEDCWCMQNIQTARTGSAALPADLRLCTDGKTVEELVQQVLSRLN